MKDTNVSILDGTTSAKRRSDILNIFRHTDEIQILLCNFKVGAEGLNLTQACNVITIEPHWNHVLENQAISRVWRNGQERPVNVHRIITNGTIENQIVKLCNEKKSVMNSYLNNNSTGRQKISKLDYYTLNKILTATINEYVNKGINIHDYK
jgi:SNF2 family DNA or RNA helicase